MSDIINQTNKINAISYNGDRTFIENGNINLNEEITNNNGDMTIEQLREVLINEVTMIYNYE